MARSDDVDSIVDAVVHPMWRSDNEIREYMARPWRDRPIPRMHREDYPIPSPTVHTYKPNDAESPWTPFAPPLFDAGTVDSVVLLPLTRGVLPNRDVGNEVCAATNRWQHDRWLTDSRAPARVRGSIRVNAGDPAAAIAEIRKWAPSRQFAQVAVPMQSLHPYGHPSYWPIWEEAAMWGLPVAVHSDGGASIDYGVTAVGQVSDIRQFEALYPLNYLYHLTSLLAEGVFERYPESRFVFADGGWDCLVPMLWRLDKDWKGLRIEVPWIKHLPSRYVKDHVRVCLRAADGFDKDMDTRGDGWFMMLDDVYEMILYGSGYPYSPCLEAEDARSRVPKAAQHAVLHDNAAAWYSLR